MFVCACARACVCVGVCVCVRVHACVCAVPDPGIFKRGDSPSTVYYIITNFFSNEII